MRAVFGVVLALLLGPVVSAQAPLIEVQSVPDALSYVTAGVNPAIAVYKAVRSDDPQCNLSKLLVSAGIVNAIGLTAQHFIHSPRPCAGSPGCNPSNGAPSLHAANSMIGVTASRGWGFAFGIGMSFGTAGLRVEAGQHNPLQALLGIGLGGFGEWAGNRLVGQCGP